MSCNGLVSLASNHSHSMLEAQRGEKSERQEHLGSGGKEEENERGNTKGKRGYIGKSLRRAESVCSFCNAFDQKNGKPLSSDVSDHHVSSP